ncbi:transposase [Pleurocapsales cyanobacterium LEGE 06147]|nr:transposase [Pleurocapsales cyanobacterium LEGE 06147]
MNFIAGRRVSYCWLLQIVPTSSAYVIEIIYEKEEQPNLPETFIAGIDLGINNLVALTSNQPGFRPMLINGRKLKAINHYYNKRKAKLQSLLKGEQKTSKKIQLLTYKRNQIMENCLRKVSRLIINTLIAKGINTLVIGKNNNWKQKVNLGKRNNQSFTQIPQAKLIEKITYKCQLVGIKVITINESYTSKTSALDLEPPVKQSSYLGKRIKPGLFKTTSGVLLNADINGSLQIIRKYALEAFTLEGLMSCAVQPLMVNPL